jgi:mono/diheme cytochrome c family protein
MTANHRGALIASVAVFLVASTSNMRIAATMQSAPTAAKTAPSTMYQDVYNGWKWWHVYCYRCHGVDAVGTTMAPSLIDPMNRRSAAEFLKIVRNGNVEKGMPSWSQLLDDKQIGQVHLYVRARSDKVLAPGRPDEVGPNGGRWVPPEGWRGR